MSGPQIGYAGKVEVATDTSGTAGSFSAVGGSAKGTITPKVATPDTTAFNSAGYVQRTPGLIDADISLECFYEPSDAGQAILLTALPARSPVWVKVWRDGTHFSVAYCYCTEFPNDVDPANPEKVAVKFAFNGATTVNPASPLTIG